MIVLEKFQAKHFEDLKEEPSVAPLTSYLSTPHLEALEQAPFAYSILKDKRAIACGGVAEYWPGRGEAWMLLSPMGPDFLAVTRIVSRFLSVCPVNRIEAAVEVDFEPGHRWAKLLGFQLDAPLLRSYLVNGKDCSLYSRVRN